MPVSSRRAPYIHFKPARAVGNSILELKNVSYSVDGTKILDNISFRLDKGDKVAIVGKNSVSKTILLELLSGEISLILVKFVGVKPLVNRIFRKIIRVF